jgi:hypothetical protein
MLSLKRINGKYCVRIGDVEVEFDNLDHALLILWGIKRIREEEET